MKGMKNVSYVQDGQNMILPVLEEYIAREMQTTYSSSAWSRVLQVLDDQRDLPMKGNIDELFQGLDLANCLRLIDRCWMDVFKKRQPIDFRTHAKELMGVRNTVAHIGSRDLSEDDAWRALDTMRRLVDTLDAEVANELGDMMRELRYGSKEGSMAATSPLPAGQLPIDKKLSGVMSTVDNALPSWREIIEPNQDVARGRYQKAEFAADLAQVARKDTRTAPEYADPTEFFARTYITEGMRGLLTNALKRVSNRGGDPVIQLKTSFGGGKTHSMLALYHMLKGEAPLRNLPVLQPVLEEAGMVSLPKANVAVLVGTALDPTSIKRPADFEGNTIHTLWGEMAMQLAKGAGKPELYKLVKSADLKGVSPGSEKLRELLDEAGPCLILMDELVAYGKKLYGVDKLPAGSFDNFITFIQELTEAARASADSIVVASIPESENEIGGDAGRITLEAIEHTFGRMEAIWKPVGVDEGFEVVRRRLFKDCAYPELRDQVCEAYFQMYQNDPESFPYETRTLDYLNKMKATYPIHPEVFDRLFNDWASLEKFQRTRGVLRLMAAVIHSLWMQGDASSMILPGTLPLDESAIRDELTRYLSEGWNDIVLTEVDGRNSIPYKQDMQERFGKVMASRRDSRTIFLGSAPSTAMDHKRGIDRRQIFLGTVQPGEKIAVFKDALNQLLMKSSYLNSSRADDRFWYDTRPTLVKTVNDRMLRIQPPQCDERIEKIVRSMAGSGKAFTRVHICPKSPSEVSDEQSVRLVILPPDATFKDRDDSCTAYVIAQEILNSKGSGPRIYKNTLVFAAPAQKQRSAVLNSAKELIAWQSIDQEKEELNLDQVQIREVKENVKAKEEVLKSRVQDYYNTLLIPYIDPDEDQKEVLWEDDTISSGTESIAFRASTAAESTDAVVTKYSPENLKDVLAEYFWNNNSSVSVKTLWDAFTSYLYMEKLKDYSVLEDALKDGVAKTNIFGIASRMADGYYEDLCYAKAVSRINLTDLIVDPSVAKDQLIADQGRKGGSPAPVSPTPSPTGGKTVSPSGDGGSEIIGPDPRIIDPDPPARPHTFYLNQMTFDSVRMTRQLSDIVQEVVSILNENPDTEMNVQFSINAYSKKGFTPDQERALLENCRNLKLDDYGINED